MKKLISLFLTLASVTPLSSTNNSAEGNLPEWYKSFTAPSEQAKPWTFWYWMFGCVSDEGIRLDLIALHDAGIAGLFLMPI